MISAPIQFLKNMKQLSLLFGLILLASGCGKAGDNAVVVESGQESGEVESTPFVLETALTKAKTENKPVLLEFTGSDWCPPCKQLEKEVLGTGEFKKYQSASLIFGKLDFPRQKQQSDDVKRNNAELAEKFEIKAFPTLVLLNSVWRETNLKLTGIDWGED